MKRVTYNYLHLFVDLYRQIKGLRRKGKPGHNNKQQTMPDQKIFRTELSGSIKEDALGPYTKNYQENARRPMEKTISSQRSNSHQREISVLKKIVAVASCFWVNTLCIGFATGLGVIFVPILDVFQSSRAQTSLMLSLCMGVIFGGAVCAGPVVIKLNPSNTIMLGGLLAALGNIGAYLAPDVNTLIITVGVVTGAGLCLAHFSSFATVNKVLKKRRGIGVSIINAGSGFGGLLFPQLNVLLLKVYGWRGTFLIQSGVLLNLAVFGCIINSATKGVFDEHKHEQKLAKKESLPSRLHLHLCKLPSFLIFVWWQLPFFICLISELLLMVDMATSKGISLVMSSYLLSAYTVGSILGSFLIGIVISFLGLSGLLATAVGGLIATFASVGFLYSHTFPWLVASSVVFGLGFGSVTTSFAVALLQLVHIRDYHFALSFMFTVSGIGDLTSGPIGGAIYDLTGNYIVLYYISMIVSVMMVVLAVSLELRLRWNPTNPGMTVTPQKEYVSTETIVTTL